MTRNHIHNSDEGIAVFSELENPRTQGISTDDLRSMLETTVQNSFSQFSPDKIEFAAMYAATGDSFYGARMGVVKGMLSTAMYAPEGFAQYLLRISQGLNEQYLSGSIEPPKDSKVATYLRSSRFVPARIKSRLEASHKRAEIGQRRIQELEALSDVYREMAKVVAEIGREYKGINVEDIFRLAEVNQFFSGKWNGSGRNLTFTDERARAYGARLQQLVQRIWDTTQRIYDSPSKRIDTPNPLSAQQLFPPRYISTDV